MKFKKLEVSHIPVDARVCDRCGQRFTVADGPDAYLDEASKKIYCDHCSKVNV